MTIVEQIHQEFNSAQSQLLLRKPNAAAERLFELGFHKSKSTNDYFIHNEYTCGLAERYQRLYPNYRYITEKQVELICAKYGLVCAPVERYLGEVPISKVAAMIAFKIRKGDAYHRYLTQFGVEREPVFNHYRTFFVNELALGADKTHEKGDENEMIGATGLWICAPESEIDTEGLTKLGHNIGQIQVKDPVVLQPVIDGFLIVTAWGDEASDENVVNHKMN